MIVLRNITSCLTSEQLSLNPFTATSQEALICLSGLPFKRVWKHFLTRSPWPTAATADPLSQLVTLMDQIPIEGVCPPTRILRPAHTSETLFVDSTSKISGQLAE